MENKMKSVVKYDNVAGATEIREVPVPVPGPDDVIVRVAFAGICGTDPHMHHNKVSFKVDVPLILGHEFSGTVESVGINIKRYAKGDRVTAETHAEYCGKCELCRDNKYHLCRKRKGYGFHVDGAFAKYVKVPERILHSVPENINLDEAALTEPLCVAYMALVVNSKIKPGDTVVVIGPGPIGLLCVKIASISGAGSVILIGTDGDAERLHIGNYYGATMSTIKAGNDLIDHVAKLGEGYGADLIIDTAGTSDTLMLSLKLIKPGGQITKIGWGPLPVGFSLDPIIAKSITLKGHFSHTWDVWEKCLALLGNGQIDLKPIITHKLPISEWEKGFKLVEAKKAIKVLLTPED